MVFHAQALRLGACILDTHGGGIAGRHHHRLDTFRSDGIHRDSQGQSRIHASGQADHRPLKAVLLYVVADAQHQSTINALRLRQVFVNHARQRPHAIGADLEVRRVNLFHERPAAHHPPPVGRHDEGFAVEHQLVLTAYLIDVDHGHGRLCQPLPQHRFTLAALDGMERRGVEVQHHTRPRRLGLRHRPGLP